MTSPAPSSGRVFAHVGQPFEERAYDVVVLGGGRMGLAAAFYLRTFQPDARVLIVERGGIPSEGGLTGVARGVWTALDLPSAWKARARWTRGVWRDPASETGVRRPHDPPFHEVGVAALSEHGEDAARFLARLPQEHRILATTLLDFERIGGAVFDDTGGYGSATTLALSYGYGAVRLGADLLLNTEARLTNAGVEVRRLDITSTMQIVVAETHNVTASHVVVAVGSEGPALLEHDLGVVTTHGRAYVQFPRLELTAPSDFPVLRRSGFTLRPGEGGLRVLPPVRGADPAGYEPVGGRLVGVPVGVRREVIDDLLVALPDVPAFESDKLDLGKAALDVPGAWEARPIGGWPVWERVSKNVSLLLGGPEADRVGLSVALDFAATLSGARGRPWEDRA
ncbi:NAD(P)/FAD-dependent oxidoreductase [Deinococcus yavapaiensis]|uniref:FAD dependent oxidoreductase n=1 Tax=Deinococcus yavapaiensis KR-236 TaxID=694435 RepID=A0A318S5Z1_9DEIO|nr:FAD-dependent oxidoreductase [Deinococcus yavapaiensis]PYE54202.1 FAD dependent oxidoreductase [Deinococcus yavapaiensis KR-236]